MKVVLFCGGLGTRIREYSEIIPKPMIPVGHQPILWHVMQYYSHFGHKDFVLCLGFKATVVKEFFLNYRPQIYADCVVSGHGSNVEFLSEPEEDWRVTLIDTGIWTDEVIAARAAEYGISAADYRKRNVLGAEVTSADVAGLVAAMCGRLFSKVTGAQLPIDGGNERVI